MAYKQGDIVIVPFPCSDLSSVKQRPVLILSKAEDIVHSNDLITCGITSHLKDAEHSILIDTMDLVEGNIPIKSRIKVNKLFTLDKRIIKKKIARLKKETFDNVRGDFKNLV